MRIAVISDIHSDFSSLENAFRKIWDKGCDMVACLGDIVGYSYHYSEWLDGRDPDACIEMVKEHCEYVICGNHDLNAALKLPKNYVELGMPGNWYEMDLNDRMKSTGSAFWMYDDEIEAPISEENAGYLRNLPEQLIIGDNKFRILMTHFVYPDLTGNKQAAPSGHSDFLEHISLIRKNRCRVGLAGHAHLEGHAQITKKAFAMNYFREADILRRPQLIIVPAITRSKARNGYLILDTEKHKFESIPLD